MVSTSKVKCPVKNELGFKTQSTSQSLTCHRIQIDRWMDGWVDGWMELRCCGDLKTWAHMFAQILYNK